MAVAISSHTNLTASSGSVNQLTITVNTSGASSLIVYTYNQVNSAGDTTGVTADGVAMTLMATTARSDNTGRQIKSWGLHNPTQAASINIVVSRATTSTALLVASAYAMSGTDTGTPIPTAESANCKTAQNTGTTVSITLGNPANAGVTAFGIFDADSQTAGTGLTLDSTNDIISDFRSSPFPATANLAMTANASSGTNALIASALLVAATPSGPTNLKTWDGITKANTKTINGVAIANIKTVNGIT